MSVGRVIIEERRAGFPALEESLVAGEAMRRGLTVERITWKPFVRRQFSVLPNDIACGSVAFVRAALQSIGRELPPHTPYPDSLQPWLHRRIWRADRLGDVLSAGVTCFIKPAKRWKRFTGFVLESPNPAELHGVSRREPVWCSEVVRFASEWRAYVVQGEIRYVGHCPAGGDSRITPDRVEIDRCVESYGRAPSGYAIDFGVLSTGETALVECNDGFSVGAYDRIQASDYFDMVAMRWREMAEGAS